ncbi:MAG: hypothetical protein H7338_21210, partial [Candidatus Sericytochromatia bacterium]|nr:hypothetical protein [Candidatus Sericytochromatia bacterium]
MDHPTVFVTVAATLRPVALLLAGLMQGALALCAAYLLLLALASQRRLARPCPAVRPDADPSAPGELLADTGGAPPGANVKGAPVP